MTAPSLQTRYWQLSRLDEGDCLAMLPLEFGRFRQEFTERAARFDAQSPNYNRVQQSIRSFVGD